MNIIFFCNFCLIFGIFFAFFSKNHLFDDKNLLLSALTLKKTGFSVQRAAKKAVI